jgi:hypothetical protein
MSKLAGHRIHRVPDAEPLPRSTTTDPVVAQAFESLANGDHTVLSRLPSPRRIESSLQEAALSGQIDITGDLNLLFGM